MASVTFQEYCETKRSAATKKGAVKIPTDISERWEDRVVKGNLLRLGASAAQEYLNFYGKGIGAGKCVHLALKAEVESRPDIARGFWARAYELETGLAAPTTDGTGDAASLAGKAAVIVRTGVASFDSSFSQLPPDLQPGHIATMQPVDAPVSRDYYIQSPLYIGMPKRDGNRLVIIGEGDSIWYQSRSRNLRRPFSIEADEGLKAAIQHFGTFIIDGELFYLSASGSEHRTGAQAATVNINSGVSDGQVKTTYGVFSVLYFKGVDMRNCSDLDRFQAGAQIVNWLHENGWSQYFELVPVAITTQEKQELCDRQKAEGREGEVWRLVSAPYVGGDDRTGDWIRTKYLTDVVGLVTGLTPTTADGRLFGALEISLPDGGGGLVNVGSAGTGFSLQQADDLARRFAASRSGVKVLLTTRGFTEGGKLWQASFVDFAEDDEALTLTAA